MVDKTEPSAFEKFQELLRKIVKVPKDEADREAKNEDAIKDGDQD